MKFSQLISKLKQGESSLIDHQVLADPEILSGASIDLAEKKPLIIDPNYAPHVILICGVNGSGKTTTIGKMAKQFADEGELKEVLSSMEKEGKIFMHKDGDIYTHKPKR